ncbi:unnamed protein product [Meganyctiphanes norvegica]|uniref:Sorting nexin-13 n=1 Tax=Meganyctiphanes norvegica TaxID=48144 RepID=A0AAV2PJA8_MEGNR
MIKRRIDKKKEEHNKGTMNMSVYGWVALALALPIGTFGFFTSLLVIICSIVIAAGWLTVICWRSKLESENIWVTTHRSHLPLPQEYQHKINEGVQINIGSQRCDRRITGSTLIDEQLNGVVELVIRDYVLTWYSQLSNHPGFVTQLQRTCQHALVQISNRCKSMDWVGYLTNRLVDDVVAHLRLYREARGKARGMASATEELIDQFFDQEAEKEKDICRDEVCLKPDVEKDYLSDLLEIVLYYIMTSEDFSNAPLRSAVIEILVSAVILPVVSMVSDPDYINSLIVWGCTDIPISSELFVNVIKSSNNVEELEAVRSFVTKEITNLRSQDSGGREEGNEVKQQISSLDFVRRAIENRINRLDKGSETDSMGLPVNLDYRQICKGKLFQLPLEAILKNSLTLDHFLNYMASINAQHYVNLYLNIECWRTTVSERLCAFELERLQNLEEAGNISGVTMPDLRHDHFSQNNLSSHKEEAECIYEQSLSEKASPRVSIDDSVIKRLILRIRSEKVSETWFDEVQSALFLILQENDLFLPAFKRSVWYIRLLAELDLLKDVSRSDEEDSISLDDVSMSSLEQPADECEPALVTTYGSEGSVDCVSVASSQSAENLLKNVSSGSSRGHSPQGSIVQFSRSPGHTRTPSLTPMPYTLTARIIDTEIVREGSKSHAIYIVSVMRRDTLSISEEIWHVFRRYSEFHDFHLSICSKFVDLTSCPFPSKRMLNNLAAWFLEKRKQELDVWLQTLLAPANLQSHPGLQDALFTFLEGTSYHASYPQNLARKMEDNLVGPLRLSVRSMSDAVRSMPDTVLTTMDGMVDGIVRRFAKTPLPRINPSDFNNKGSIDLEGDENIPLRILLLLMDEVFDLRSKDQWFRRRIMLFLRQILKAMFGDIVNRRIIDYVAYVTSPEQVADYIKTFKESLWPNGVAAPEPTVRDNDMKLRTKVTARMSMLASISDELKAILGSQTTARGVLGIYETVQWTSLNKRLVYVLLEGIIESLLAEHPQIPQLLRKLHNGSSRVIGRSGPNARKNRNDRM